MNSTTMWIIVAVIAAVVILGITMGPRLKRAKFNLGKTFSSEVEGTTAGPTVTCADALGVGNRISADGAGATVRDVSAVGENNVISAGSGDVKQKQKQKRSP